MASNMSLLNEDMWPSLPRTHALFADTPLTEKEVNKCFCKSLNTKSVKVIKDFFRQGFQIHSALMRITGLTRRDFMYDLIRKAGYGMKFNTEACTSPH